MVTETLLLCAPFRNQSENSSKHIQSIVETVLTELFIKIPLLKEKKKKITQRLRNTQIIEIIDISILHVLQIPHLSGQRLRKHSHDTIHPHLILKIISFFQHSYLHDSYDYDSRNTESSPQITIPGTQKDHVPTYHIYIYKLSSHITRGRWRREKGARCRKRTQDRSSRHVNSRGI